MMKLAAQLLGHRPRLLFSKGHGHDQQPIRMDQCQSPGPFETHFVRRLAPLPVELISNSPARCLVSGCTPKLSAQCHDDLPNHECP